MTLCIFLIYAHIIEYTFTLYMFQVKINPDYKLAEATFENNVASCDLVYTEYYAAVRNCTYERP